MLEQSHRVFTPETLAKLREVFRDAWTEFCWKTEVSFDAESEIALKLSLAKRIFHILEAGETKIENIKVQAKSMMKAHCFVHLETVTNND
jgi:hypothetical protein